MHQGVVRFCVVSFPISPFELYPTVYTIPSWSAITPVLYTSLFVVDAIAIMSLSVSTGVAYDLDDVSFVNKFP